MSLPYYKRFPRDFLEGTIGLSFEVKGAYAILLDLIYMRDGRLADDGRYIAGQLGCSVRKWSAIRDELIEAGKITVSAGIISNFRADYLTEETRKYQDKQAEIAAKPRKINKIAQPKPSQSESEPELRGEAKASLSCDPFEAFWSAYPRKIGKPKAKAAFAAALRRTTGPPEIMAGLQPWIAAWTDPQFIPHPTTWLNRDGWNDKPPVSHERPDHLNAAPDPRRANTESRRGVWVDVIAERDGGAPGPVHGPGGTPAVDRGEPGRLRLAHAGHG